MKLTSRKHDRTFQNVKLFFADQKRQWDLNEDPVFKAQVKLLFELSSDLVSSYSLEAWETIFLLDKQCQLFLLEVCFEIYKWSLFPTVPHTGCVRNIARKIYYAIAPGLSFDTYFLTAVQLKLKWSKKEILIIWTLNCWYNFRGFQKWG